MSAGKNFAPGGPQHNCQLTGWAAPDLTATSPDELLTRVSPPLALLIRVPMVICYLVDPHPPPHHITGKRSGALKEALPKEPGANPSPNPYHEAYRQWFTKPARIDAGGFLFNPIVSELVHTLSVLKANS